MGLAGGEPQGTATSVERRPCVAWVIDRRQLDALAIEIVP